MIYLGGKLTHQNINKKLKEAINKLISLIPVRRDYHEIELIIEKKRVLSRKII